MPRDEKPKQSQPPKSDKPGASEKTAPCREEQQGVSCSGNEPLDQGPAGKSAPESKQRHDPEEQRPGSTEKSPGH